MVIVTTNISEEANKNLRIYMANKNILDKRLAINEILEKNQFNLQLKDG